MIMNSELIQNKEYLNWFSQIKTKVWQSKRIAALRVNHELLELYWFIGRALYYKEKDWGDKFIENLSRDLKLEFPDIKGFSKTNLKYMRWWFSYYTTNFKIGQHSADQLSDSELLSKVQQPVALLISKFGQQVVGQNVLDLKSVLFQIPWGHHIKILEKTKFPDEALFYVIKTIQNGWSRSILQEQILSDLYKRQGKSINNFENTLNDINTDLAIETFKNPYNLEFLGLEEDIKEKELEKSITNNLKKFLLELGKGFSYVGNQFNINVEGDDFFLDLLFFNYYLNCFVIFELKIGDYKLEYSGKLNAYINIVNDKVKLKEHNSTIGILLCRTSNKSIIKYSIDTISNPVGVAEYKLKKELPEKYKDTLPSVEELLKGIESIK
jgi:predicted nuclease of restriction endonuclease-like (RecB) superfamily